MNELIFLIISMKAESRWPNRIASRWSREKSRSWFRKLPCHPAATLVTMFTLFSMCSQIRKEYFVLIEKPPETMWDSWQVQDSLKILRRFQKSIEKYKKKTSYLKALDIGATNSKVSKKWRIIKYLQVTWENPNKLQITQKKSWRISKSLQEHFRNSENPKESWKNLKESYWIPGNHERIPNNSKQWQRIFKRSERISNDAKALWTEIWKWKTVEKRVKVSLQPFVRR